MVNLFYSKEHFLPAHVNMLVNQKVIFYNRV